MRCWHHKADEAHFRPVISMPPLLVSPCFICSNTFQKPSPLLHPERYVLGIEHTKHALSQEAGTLVWLAWLQWDGFRPVQTSLLILYKLHFAMPPKVMLQRRCQLGENSRSLVSPRRRPCLWCSLVMLQHKATAKEDWAGNRVNCFLLPLLQSVPRQNTMLKFLFHSTLLIEYRHVPL